MTLLLVSLALLLVIGVPIAYALGISGLAYFYVVHPELISILPQRLLSGMDSYTMIALPLFILMGLLMNEGGITKRLISFSLVFVGKLRGGLGLVNVIASMIFGGISGSSVADTASIGAILIPEMEKEGYPLEFSCGVTVASSTMGMIIPPSVPMVIYALIAEESVGKLFLGSLIPGIMIGLIMLGITMIISYIKKYPVEDVKLTCREVFSRVRQSLVALVMPVFVIGSVVAGIATATESAGMGVLYAFIAGMFIFRDLKIRQVFPLMRSSIRTSANVMIIIALSKLYIWILAIEKVPQQLSVFMEGLSYPAWGILLVVNAVILITGTFIDVSPAILLIAPVLLPSMAVIGVSPVQFGVLLITGLAVGLVTPPVGMCLNVASAISGLKITRIFRAAVPFLLANLVTLLAISFIPQISLWLPGLLMK